MSRTLPLIGHSQRHAHTPATADTPHGAAASYNTATFSATRSAGYSLSHLPQVEFTLGPMKERSLPPYNDIEDPHLVPYWARREMLIHERARQRQELRRKQEMEARRKEEARRRFRERRRQEREELAARKGYLTRKREEEEEEARERELQQQQQQQRRAARRLSPQKPVEQDELSAHEEPEARTPMQQIMYYDESPAERASPLASLHASESEEEAEEQVAAVDVAEAEAAAKEEATTQRTPPLSKKPSSAGHGTSVSSVSSHGEHKAQYPTETVTLPQIALPQQTKPELQELSKRETVGEGKSSSSAKSRTSDHASVSSAESYERRSHDALPAIRKSPTELVRELREHSELEEPAEPVHAEEEVKEKDAYEDDEFDEEEDESKSKPSAEAKEELREQSELEEPAEPVHAEEEVKEKDAYEDDEFDEEESPQELDSVPRATSSVSSSSQSSRSSSSVAKPAAEAAVKHDAISTNSSFKSYSSTHSREKRSVESTEDTSYLATNEL